jgi:cytoplasmic iron level regulating protein YaaA (DUF328/UPF0246 family)
VKHADALAKRTSAPNLRDMLILLSPAKNLDWSPPPDGLPMTAPALAKDAAALAKVAKSLSSADLKRLMDVSDKLADLNRARFQAFGGKVSREAAKHAVLAFNGDVYQGLSAKTLSADDLAFAQRHLRILSGLYGVLRPLDAMEPYRLEMGTKLATERGEDLYDYWGAKIAKALNAEAAGDLILNLASDEYFSAVDRKALKGRVITPKFLDVKDGKARSVFMFVKRARGMMARFAIEQRISDEAGLKHFSAGGYRLDKAASDADTWVFTRPQPKAASAA